MVPLARPVTCSNISASPPTPFARRRRACYEASWPRIRYPPTLMLNVAINGYGRVGRAFVRALVEREAAGRRTPFSLVAINDPGRPEDLRYLTRYDTTHGRLDAP